MKKIIYALIAFIPVLAFGADIFTYNHSVYVKTDVPLCTISVTSTQKFNSFVYNPDMIVLAQPEWDNEYTKTVGIPQCQTGLIKIGSYKGQNKGRLSLFSLGLDVLSY